MAQPDPDALTYCFCPRCQRRLSLILRVPPLDPEDEDETGWGGYQVGEIREQRPIQRSDDMGSVLLWVRNAERGEYEEIMRNSASGPGPDDAASGDVECPEHGELDVDALCAYYERQPIVNP